MIMGTFALFALGFVIWISFEVGRVYERTDRENALHVTKRTSGR